MLASVGRGTTLHPLAAAAQWGHMAAVSRLLQLGAPPDHDSSSVAGVQQCTPLMLAAGDGQGRAGLGCRPAACAAAHR